MLPAASVARTENVCPAELSELYVAGLEQAVHNPPSSWHWNVAASVAVNAKVAVVWLVGFAGVDVMLVSGAVRSIVQAAVAGVGSTVPTVSVALTAKVWAPVARPEYVAGLEQAVQAPLSSWHWKVAASVAVNAKLAVV